MITVIGLGLGSEDTLTLGALKALREAEEIILQTGNVPVADYLKKEGCDFETLDELYDAAADFEELLEDEGLTVIEWSQFIPELIPEEYLSVSIHLLDEDQREFIFEAHGTEYEALLEEIA